MKLQLAHLSTTAAGLVLAFTMLPVAIAARSEQAIGQMKYMTHGCNSCHGVAAAGTFIVA